MHCGARQRRENLAWGRGEKRTRPSRKDWGAVRSLRLINVLNVHNDWVIVGVVFIGGLALDVKSAPFKAFLVVGGVLFAEDVFSVGGFPVAAGESAFHEVGSFGGCGWFSLRVPAPGWGVGSLGGERFNPRTAAVTSARHLGGVLTQGGG